MNQKAIQLTQAQYDLKLARRKEIIEVERIRIAEAIDIARGFGDLKENAEYHSAKDEQGRIETELLIIENELKYAEIIKKTDTNDIVRLGNHVTVEELDTGKTYEFTIIGQDGDGINEVEVRSKIGEAIFNKPVGTIVSYESNEASPRELRFKIINIA